MPQMFPMSWVFIYMYVFCGLLIMMVLINFEGDGLLADNFGKSSFSKSGFEVLGWLW
nr:ATP synthase subunit 8 [Nedyopus patrioticus patrioticus]